MNYLNKIKRYYLLVDSKKKEKGFNILLEAFNNLSLEFNNVQLNVVGPGDPKKIKYRNKNIDFSKINFVGSVNQSDLPNYYNDADIVCLPFFKNESFGVIILESMASGKILVLSDIESYKNVALKKIIMDFYMIINHQIN